MFLDRKTDPTCKKTNFNAKVTNLFLFTLNIKSTFFTFELSALARSSSSPCSCSRAARRASPSNLRSSAGSPQFHRKTP